MTTDAPEAQERPLISDPEKMSRYVDHLRESFWNYMDLSLKSMEKGSELNKQLSALYERIMLINYGTIGLSVSALTAITGKVTLHHGIEVSVISIVAVGWVLLILSAFLCRSLMHYYVAANKCLFCEWQLFSSQMTASQVAFDLQRLSIPLNGFIEIEGKRVDTQVYWKDCADQVRATLGEKNPHYLKLIEAVSDLQKTAPTTSSVTIHMMQFGMLCLAIAAFLLVFAH